MTDRHEQYRAAGWWTGERLVDHFERLVGNDPHALALVDAGTEYSRTDLWDRSTVLGPEDTSRVSFARRGRDPRVPGRASTPGQTEEGDA